MFPGRNAEGRRACLELMGSEDFGALWCRGCPWLWPAGPKQGHSALESGEGKGDGEGVGSGVVLLVLCPWDLGAPLEGPFLQPRPGADVEAAEHRKLKAELRHG